MPKEIALIMPVGVGREPPFPLPLPEYGLFPFTIK